jgi:chorismate dehydratase
MDKIRISAVKYANTYPFIWGLKESGFDKRVIIETDHPSECAAKLITGKADIGLIPVAALPLLKKYYIISDYCISANGEVRTVMLLSNCPFADIRVINLDYRSRSSVNLAMVLAKNMWKKKYIWVDTSEQFDFVNIGKDEAVVLIGDQCFEFENKFKYKLDLAYEWKKQTGLPFVFACWAANRELDTGFINDFNSALKTGVDNIDKVAKAFGKSSVIREDDLRNYLKFNIDYIFDKEKQKGMNLFLELLDKL